MVGFADHGVGVVTDLAVWYEVIRPHYVTLVDVGPVDELIDLDGARGFDLDLLKLFRIDGDVGVGIDLVAFDDVVGFNLVPGVRVHFQVPEGRSLWRASRRPPRSGMLC